MKAAFKVCLIALASIFSVIILLLALLLYSPQFNSWLVLQAIKLAPEVSIEKVDGLLLGEMQLSGLSYQSEQTDVSIDSIAYRYQLANLFNQQVLFEALHITGVDVVIKDSKAEEKTESSEFILPVTLEIQDFTLNELQIKQDEATHLVKKIQVALWYQGQSLRLNQFIFDSDIVQLHGEGELLVNAQLPFKVDLTIAKSVPDFAEIKAQVSLHGDLDKIYLNADLQAPSKAHAQGWVLLTDELPSFDLQMAWAALQWPLQGVKDYASEQAKLSIKGTADRYALALDSTLFAKDLPLGALHLVGQGDTEQLTLSDLSLDILQGKIHSKGRVSWTESIASNFQLVADKLQLASVSPDYPGELSLDAKLTGQLVDKQDIRVQISRLNGVMMNKALNGTADIRYQPDISNIEQLNLRVGNNQLSMQGIVGANNTLTFKLDAANLHELSPDLQGALFAQGALDGLLSKLNVQLDLHSNGLSFQKQKISALQAKANLYYQPETTEIEQLNVRVGTNQLVMQGTVGANNALTFKLDAANLQELSPDLHGSLFAKGGLQGLLTKPSVQLDLHADGLSFQKQKIGALQAKANLISIGTGQLDLDVKAQKISLPDLAIEKLNLHSAGQLAQHKITAEVASSQGKLNLALKGDLNPEKSWQGEVKQLQIQNSPVGDWQLRQIAPLKLLFAKQDALQVETDVCLAQSTGSGLLCVHAKPEQVNGQRIEGSIKELALSVFSAWLPDNLEFNSALNSDFSLLQQQTLQGAINLSLVPGSIVVAHEKLGEQKFDFKGAQVHMRLDANQLQSTLAIELDAAKRIDGQVNVLGLEQMSNAQIDGKLNLNINDLGFLNALIEPINDIEGSIKANVYLQGGLSAPDLKGTQIDLANVKFSMPDAGIQVRDLNMAVTHGQEQQLFLKGNANIADKTLLIDGQLDHYASDQLQFKLALKGDNLQLLQLPEMQAWLSPDLTLTGNKQGIKIRGGVIVPKATLVFATLPEGSVQLSGDEVIINEEAVKVEAPSYPIDMNVFIQMGDAVSIEGFGLKSRLQGRLRATLKDNDFKLYNQLTLLDATYKAYGQELTIDKGQLLFDGDISNTGVNIVASRQASDWDDKTIAYLSLKGMLSKPTSSVYTKPALSESESLAYLLTGGSLSKSGGNSTGLLAKAALGLGGDYVDAVMGAVGLDEIDIKSTAVGQNSMVLGKRITPDLMVRYIVDVLSAQMQLAVEYKLTEHISIETRAGSTQSSDIKYTIEFD